VACSRMSLQPQNAALLATAAVVWVALFPAGIGPFTATHGPATALSAMTCDAVDFAPFYVSSASAAVSLTSGYLSHEVRLFGIEGPERPPVVALRC
jgi:hypothetical protein